MATKKIKSSQKGEIMTQLGAIIYLIDETEAPVLLHASSPCSLWHVRCSIDGIDERS
jgi:hypothetical protein